MKKFLIIGALVFGWGAAVINHDSLSGFWFLAWPLGAVVGFIAWSVFHPGARSFRRATRRVDEFRAEAVELRENNPEVYMAMLNSAEGQKAVKAGDPLGFVALCLALAADDLGVESQHQRGNVAPVPD
jgi:hypothetical protein